MEIALLKVISVILTIFGTYMVFKLVRFEIFARKYTKAEFEVFLKDGQVVGCNHRISFMAYSDDQFFISSQMGKFVAEAQETHLVWKDDTKYLLYKTELAPGLWKVNAPFAYGSVVSARIQNPLGAPVNIYPSRGDKIGGIFALLFILSFVWGLTFFLFLF